MERDTISRDVGRLAVMLGLLLALVVFVFAASAHAQTQQWIVPSSGSGSGSIASGTTPVTGGTDGSPCFNSAGFADCGNTGWSFNPTTHVLTLTSVTGNLTGTASTASAAPLSGIIGFGSGVATLLGGASSGTGGPAGTTSPTFTTPALGAATGTSANFTLDDAATATVTDMLTLEHTSSGTPAASFGAGILFQGESATVVDRDMARISATWKTATDATRASRLQFAVADAGLASTTVSNILWMGYGQTAASGDAAIGPSADLTTYIGMKAGTVSFVTGSGNYIYSLNAATAVWTPASAVQATLQQTANVGEFLWGGASLTGAATGTSTSDPFAIRTNGTDRMTFGATGTVTLATDEAVSITDAGTNTALTMLTLDHASSGTPAASFGDKIVFNGSSATVASRNMANIYSQWRTATDASRDAKLVFDVWGSAAGTNIGWTMFNTTPCCNNMAAFGPSADLTTYIGMEAGAFNLVNSGTHSLTYTGSGFTKVKGVTTAGWGMPAIYGTGRSTAQTAAVASVATYTVGSADGSFEVSANVLVTTATTHSFSVQVDYTDESNTARTLTLPMAQLAGTFAVSITNVTGAGPYEGAPLRIRCKASTAITIKTTGTFTTVTYNVEGAIVQVS